MRRNASRSARALLVAAGLLAADSPDAFGQEDPFLQAERATAQRAQDEAGGGRPVYEEAAQTTWTPYDPSRADVPDSPPSDKSDSGPGRVVVTGAVESQGASRTPDGIVPALNQSPEIREITPPTDAPPPTVAPHRLPVPPSGPAGPGSPSPEKLPFIVPYKSAVTATLLPGSGDEFGIFDVDLQSTFALPAHYGWTVNPMFQMLFLDGPARTDLPPRLYSTGVEVNWKNQIAPQFAYELALAPGLYSDFEHSDSEAFRILGRAVGFYTQTQRTQWVLGLAYLDRENVKVLPVFGAIHRPYEDLRLELIFPRPKIARRISMGHPDEDSWIYLAGEFGGGSWAVDRAVVGDDVFTYSDWRLLGGVESQLSERTDFRAEVGLVFNRELEFESGRGDFDPDATVLLRGGLEF